MELSVKNRLLDLSDSNYAQFERSLLPHYSRPVLGVRLPLLRRLARTIAKKKCDLLLELSKENSSFEEIMLVGMVIGYAPMSWEQRWQNILRFVEWIDNWSICDSCCATYKEIGAHLAESWDDLNFLLQSREEFAQRFAVVMMLDYYLTDEFIERVVEAWQHTIPRGYYVEMALGWGLSVAYLRYPHKIGTLLQEEGFSLACRRKACQKILESRRTPLEARGGIRELRKSLKD